MRVQMFFLSEMCVCVCLGGVSMCETHSVADSVNIRLWPKEQIKDKTFKSSTDIIANRRGQCELMKYKFNLSHEHYCLAQLFNYSLSGDI